MPRLANKVALITGAAGGQGTAEAELFVRESAAVMLTDIDQPGGEALAKRLTEQGGLGALPGARRFQRGAVEGDSRRGGGGVRRLAHPGQQRRHDRPAGHRGYIAGGLEPHDRRQPHRADARHEALRAGHSGFGGGAIINISSTAGLTAHDDAAYTATKWGLRGL